MNAKRGLKRECQAGVLPPDPASAWPARRLP